jgi:malate permease and related proteins
MDVLNKLLTNVLPLYAFIGAGYALKKWMGLSGKPVSKLLLYLLIPVVIFENLLKAELSQMLIVAAIIFIMACLMNLPGWLAHKYIDKDLNKHLLLCSFSYFNIGWFGIPIVMALFGESQMPLIISAYMGNVFYGDTIGYYLMGRSKDLSVGDAIKKVFKIPAVYASIAAIVANIAGLELPESIEPVMDGVSWVLSALGMVMIGIGLSNVDFKETDYSKFSKILGLRYLAAGVIMAGLVFLESITFGQLEREEQLLMLLIPAFPIAANLVVFAAYLDTENENAALLVSLSSIISLVIVPIACVLLFQ